MRTESPLYFDFNQMLVMSVLVHCLFMTLVLFMPKTGLLPQKVQPSFFVELVDLSALPGLEPSQYTGDTQTETAPVVPEKKTEAPPVTKTESTTVKVPPSLLEHLPLQELAKADNTSKGKLVEKLDQVAKLETQTPSKKKKAPALVESNVHDLESLKLAPEVKTSQKKKAPRNMEAMLQQLQTLKMEENTETVAEIPIPQVVNEDLTMEEMEFAMLAQKEVEHKKPGTQTVDPAMMKTMLALKELKKNQQSTPVINPKIETTVHKTEIIQSQAEANKVLQKIAALQKNDVVISFELDQGVEVQAPNFKSEILNVESPELNKQVQGKTGTQSPSVETYIFKGQAGSAQADANPLSEYVGLIYKKVMSNWRNPLGAGQSRVVVFFYVHKAGNISKPKLFVSSGDDQLDRLALQAVKDSAPFAAIPPELNKSNLPIRLNFNYVYKK